MQVFHILYVVALPFMVSIMADVDGPIPYASSCDPTSSASCSSNSYCQCAKTTTGQAICTQQMSCDYATVCDVGNTCEKVNSTCVIDSRCPMRNLCYSIVIFSPDLCPPLSTATNGDSKK